jgi:glycolate oxidase FAD binding subunit
VSSPPTDPALQASEISDVLAELAKACDDQVRRAEDGDEVGGLPARLVAAPGSTREAADVLRVAADHRLRVVARGHGTKLHWGATPSGVELIVDTTRLSGVVEHAAGDLVAVVGAGTALATLQEVVGGAGQELAFDDPLGSTVGGAIATSPSGPRRLLRGTLRDLLIGVTFVRSDGVVAKAGGKVVKNVAGYDFGKLLTGSYGTLGLITEAIFRLHPRPVRSHHVTRTISDAADIGPALRAVLASQTVPSAVDVDWPAEGPRQVSVLLEGTEDGVEQRADAVARLLDTDVGDGAAPPWWGHYPFGPDDVAIKLTCPLTEVGTTMRRAHARAAEHGLSLASRASAAGVVHAATPGDGPPEAVASLVHELRAGIAAYDGSVLVLAAPQPLREGLDLWGPVPGLALMRRLKHELDPVHRLSPGRFVGGI